MAQTGPVAAYGFDEGTGTTTADASGDGFTGTLVNGPVWTAGQHGSALQFDATDDGDDSNDPQVVLGRTIDIPDLPLTISAWVNPTDYIDYRAIVSKRDAPLASDMRLEFGLTQGNGRVYVFTASPTPNDSYQFFYAPPANTWTHLAIVADASGTRLYVNGALQETLGVITLGTSTSANAVIGGTGEGPGGDNDPFKGKIDDLRIYNRALNAAEIQADMNAAVVPVAPETTPPTTPTGLSAAAVNGVQIDLAWTASTDNVQVSGYRVERCQGAGCSNFVEVGTAPSNSFSDAGLAPSSAYSYRVRAVDPAGNLSTYSNVASATTTNVVPGPVAAYAFEEGSGTTTADLSGSGNTGTLNSSVAWTPAGQHGNALVFSDGYVDLGAAASLQITGSMTISAWINPSAFPIDDATIVSNRGPETGYQLDVTPDTGVRTIGFKLPNDASGNSIIRYGANVLQLNQWYHIAGVYDAQAKTLNVYLNGVLDNGTLLGTVPASQNLTPMNVNIGQRSGLSGYPFLGTIDDVRIYNRALNAAEIQADMNTAVGGTAADTIAPTAPGALTATAAGATQIDLSWTASTDNVGVTGYRVERCQGVGCDTFVEIAQPVTTSFNDIGLGLATSYRYRVRAVDAAGNVSPASNVASATTQAPSDSTAPTAPTNLAATAVSTNQINLSWIASADDVGVTGYQVERCQGVGCGAFVQIATATGTSFSDTNLIGATSYSYRVRASDAAGNLSAYSNVASATLSVVSLTVTSPAPGAVIASDTVTVLGSFSGPDNTGINVSGIGNTVATIVGSEFVATNVQLQPGANTLTVNLTTSGNQIVTTTLTVTSTGSAAISVSAHPAQGVAPLGVNFSIDNRTGNAILSVQADYAGTGTFASVNPAALSNTYTPPGIYQPAFIVTDSSGAITQQTVPIVVQDPAQIDQTLRAEWAAFTSALAAQDTTQALQHFDLEAQEKYSPVFSALLPNLPQIVASFSALQLMSVSGDVGEYVVSRNIDGVNQNFFVYFLRDNVNGVWRLNSM